MPVLAFGPGSSHAFAATIALDEATQREVLVEVGSGRRATLATVDHILNALESFEADQAFMLAFADANVPFWRFNIARIDYFLEQTIDCHRAQGAVLLVLRKMRIVLKEALNFGLGCIVSCRKSFEGLANHGRENLIWHQNLAPT
nr:hypothetical protein [Ruegeria pomeroyi]